MLQNPIYSGRIGHRGQIHNGEHEAIIEPELWEAVQRSLAANRRRRRNGAKAKEPSLLAGLIVDAEGKRFTPTHAVKQGKRYRYYVSRSLITDPSRRSEAAAYRLPAAQLERLVLKQIGDLLRDQNRIWRLLRECKLPHHAKVSMWRRANKLAQDLSGLGDAARSLLLRLVRKVVVHADKIETEIGVANLLCQLSQGKPVQCGAEPDEAAIVLTSPCRLLRCGLEMRLVIDCQAGTEHRMDANLIAAIVRAHEWWRELCSGKVRTIREIAKREGSGERHVARILKLAFLAPDITAAVLDGRQPPHLTADQLIRMSDLPRCWQQQSQRLGFARPA
jgi:site-specific DNA recombinase